MRVLDNLENYDIPSGFHLTAEQEEQLAADLKEIVLALIPLRSSKLKTRQYLGKDFSRGPVEGRCYAHSSGLRPHGRGGSKRAQGPDHKAAGRDLHTV